MIRRWFWSIWKSLFNCWDIEELRNGEIETLKDGDYKESCKEKMLVSTILIIGESLRNYATTEI